MRPSSSEPIVKDTTLLSGWLFADFLLALAVIFLTSVRGEPPHTDTGASPAISFPAPAITATATSLYTITFADGIGPTSTPTPTLSVVPLVGTATVTTATPQASISHVPLELTIKTNPDALLAGQPDELTHVKEMIRQAAGQNSVQGRAGIVLTFGFSASPTEGGQIATVVNRLLSDALPTVFEGAALRSFHQIDATPARRGEVLIEVYMFVEQ